MKNKIENTIKEVLNRMNVTFSEIVITDEGDITYFEIKSDDSKLLIGSRGETLRALHHIISRAASEGSEHPKFVLDVNGYERQNREKIIQKAKILGERVETFKMDVRMEPAPSYERLLIHELFSGSSNIKTESEGRGRDRRIVLKYVGGEEI